LLEGLVSLPTPFTVGTRKAFCVDLD